jgi:hypothetical protein
MIQPPILGVMAIVVAVQIFRVLTRFEHDEDDERLAPDVLAAFAGLIVVFAALVIGDIP